MVTQKQGKAEIGRIVRRYLFVKEHPQLLKGRLLSEQDITTKFVLPMLDALNWDVLKITKDGPEVSEKCFRERSNVHKGLPDIKLKSGNEKIFGEVKRPPLGKQGMANLERYEDGHFLFLTSFEDMEIYTRKGKRRPKHRFSFNYEEYVAKFDELWRTLSNTIEGKRRRAAIKARR